MGYNEDDALIRIEILFQYGQGGDIQIIRRFVQKEYIGAGATDRAGAVHRR